MRSFAVLQSMILGLSTIAAALDAGETRHDCRARAWVRAPDLEPGEILQGDVRIKLDADCSDVSSYSIGLRFMERSWVKTRREGVIFPEPPTENMSPPMFTSSNGSIFQPLTLKTEIWSDGLWLQEGENRTAMETYHNILSDPTLWLAREEERIGFETSYILRAGGRLSHELVDHFSILVPFTNYPPAFDMTFDIPRQGPPDRGDSEHIYAYFVDVKFANGTRHEVPAGLTSFRTATKPGHSQRETVKAVAGRSSKCKTGHNCPSEEKDDAPEDEFTLEVTFPNGRHFAQGSANNVTIIAHQTGSGLQRPFGLKSLDTKVQQNLTWAAMFALDNKTATTLLTSGSVRASQLLPVFDDEIIYRQFSSKLTNALEIPHILETRALESGMGFSSEAVTIPFNVPQNCYPSFVAYYQTTEVSLEVTLEMWNDSLAKMNTPEMDEFSWTPIKEETEQFRATIPIFVHPRPRNEGSFEDQEPTHYLSPDARAPVFMDPSSISELQLRSREDRDKLAPIAQAQVIASDREIVTRRYYASGFNLRGPTAVSPYYVGDVWLRKVLAKDKGRGFPAEAARLMVQT